MVKLKKLLSVILAFAMGLGCISSFAINSSINQVEEDVLESSSILDYDESFTADINYYLAPEKYNISEIQLDSIGTEQRVKIISNIASENIDYQFQLPEGAYVDYVRHLYTGEKLDGAIVVYDKNDNVIAVSNVPKAVDVNGVKVPANFIIEGNKLTLEVQHHNFDLLTYPIQVNYNIVPFGFGSTNIADYWYNYGKKSTPMLNFYFSGYKWMDYMGIGYSASYVMNTSWKAVKEYFSNDPDWYNEQGLYEQYMCHYNVYVIAGEWNIEPWHPAVGLKETIRKNCNP